MATRQCPEDVLERLGQSLSMYDDVPTILDTSQQRTFSKFIKGLDLTNVPKSVSKTTLYVKSRALELSSDIYNRISPEVLILCGLTYPVHTLGTLPREGLIPQIHKWWMSANHPAGLSILSTRLCKEHFLDDLFKKDCSGNPTLQETPAVPTPTDGQYFISFLISFILRYRSCNLNRWRSLLEPA